MSQIQQKSWEAVKRLDRLAPILHTSADPSGNGCTPNKLPLEAQGGTWGVLGVKHSKVWGSCQNGWNDWHQLWFTSADSSGNGHRRLNPSRPSIPQGAFRGWGVRGSQIKKIRGTCQTAEPIGTNVGTRRRIRLGMDIG